MTVCRVLPLVAVLIGVPLHQAEAQFGGMPGMPGSPGFGARPSAPPPHCQQLLSLRDEAQKRASAIQASSQRKAKPTAREVCKLFQTFLATETKMIKAFDVDGPRCGVPPQVQKQMKDQHAQAQQIASKVCEAAAQQERPAGPSLSDALGTTPAVPDGQTERRGGAFDTLSGNALAR